MCLCYAKCHAALAHGVVQFDQKIGSGEIEYGNRAEEKDHQPHAIAALVQQLEEAVTHVLNVEVEQGTFDAEDKHLWIALVLRVAQKIGKVFGAWYATEFRCVRP